MGNVNDNAKIRNPHEAINLPVIELQIVPKIIVLVIIVLVLTALGLFQGAGIFLPIILLP